MEPDEGSSQGSGRAQKYDPLRDKETRGANSEHRKAWLADRERHFGRQAAMYAKLDEEHKAKRAAEQQNKSAPDSLKHKEMGGASAQNQADHNRIMGAKGSKPQGSTLPSDAGFKKGTHIGGGPEKGSSLGGDLANNGKKQGRGAKAKNFFKKHKKWVIGGGVGMGAAAPLIFLLLFLLGSLELPNFTENMITYGFAKVARQNAKFTELALGEELANESKPDNLWQQAKDKVTSIKNATMTAFLGKYDLSKVTRNLRSQITPHYENSSTFLGRRRLVAISIPTSAGVKKIPIPSNFTQAGNFQTYRQIRAALDDMLKTTDPKIPSVIRSRAMDIYLKSVGAKLSGLVASRFKGKKGIDANAEIEAESHETVRAASASSGLSSSEEAQAAEDAIASEDEVLSDPEKIKGPDGIPGIAEQQAPDSVGLPNETAKVINNAIAVPKLISVTKKIVGFLNPIYNVAVPICTIYDGSKYSPEKTNSQDNAQQAEAALTISSAGQQEAGGNNWNVSMSSAWVYKLGDTANSTALLRADNKLYNTIYAPGPQQPAFGGFTKATIFDVALKDLPSLAHALDASAETTCPAFTNLAVGIGLGVANLTLQAVLGFFSGGAEPVAQDALEASADASADVAVKSITSRIVSQLATKIGKQFSTKEGLKETYDFVKQLGGDTLRQGGLIAGTTFLAKYIVLIYSGLQMSGTATGRVFTEQVTSGTDLIAQGYEQTKGGGIPMMNADVAQSDGQDKAFIADYNKSQSAYTRYIALNNPNSLLAHVGTTIMADTNHNFFTSLTNNITRLGHPMSLASSIFGIFNRSTFAAPPSKFDTAHYANVQFGWTEAEYALIDKTPSYSTPSVNELKLQESGKLDDIIKTYGRCFTDPPGTLIGDDAIVRNGYGDVVYDQGLCSPKNLGVNNDQGFGDNVFRYRLSQSYTTVMGIQLGLQDVPAAN